MSSRSKAKSAPKKQMSPYLRILPVVVTAFVCLFLIIAAVLASRENQRLENAAPDFTVVDASGKTVSLSDIRNKPVVVNLWATWCTYCIQEMPTFQKIYEEYGDDVVFLMVNMTEGDETVARAKAFIEDGGYTFPVYFDTEQSAYNAYNATGLPMTLFIRRDGSLYKTHKGLIYEDALRNHIESILK